MKSLRVIGVLLAVAVCVALAGAALANKGSKPVRHSSKVHNAKAVSKAARQISRATVSSKSEQSAGESDTDNIQSGDQTTPDQPAQSAEAAQSENSGDTETGQPGEPPAGQTHEDPAGQDVNHDCTGNCQE